MNEAVNLDRYKDLEDLIYKGFLHRQVSVGGVNFVFKSISDLEYDQVKIMSGIENKNPYYNKNFHINYFFYSLYLVNGVNILEKRDDLYEDIFDIVKLYPNVLITKIFSTFSDFVARQNNSLKFIEPYSYEEISRYHWLYRRKISLNDIKVTGIRGSERLGLNQFQKYWSILNYREDQKEVFDENYNLTKFLASFSDPKSVKKIDASDKARKEEEKERRIRIKAIGTPEERKYITGPTDTRDGIIAELEKQMRGEKDAHDLAIEEYEKELRGNMLQQMHDLKRMQEDRKKNNEVPIDETRPITPEEMAERMRLSRERSDRKVFYRENSEAASKLLSMSNITDEDVIRDTGIITKDAYNQIINDDFIKQIRDIPEKIKSEEEYKKQQRKLAFQHGLDIEGQESLDFPNLRKK